MNFLLILYWNTDIVIFGIMLRYCMCWKLNFCQVRHQMDDLQSMYGKEREENQRLVTDCDKYMEKFCIMEGQISSLKQEIDELRTMVLSTILIKIMDKYTLKSCFFQWRLVEGQAMSVC